jgi:hypothetical protein
MLGTWLRRWMNKKGRANRQPRHFRPRLEALEDRFVPSGLVANALSSLSAAAVATNNALVGAAPDLRTFHPFRYSFVVPQVTSIGSASSPSSYDGNVTVLNLSPTPATHSIVVEFPDLPSNVTLLNATGNDPNNHNAPFIAVNIGTLPLDQALRIPVKLTNSTGKPLSSYYLGYTIEAFEGTVK